MTKKKLNRVIRFSLFQVIILPIAGICQLMFVTILAREIQPSNLKDAFYILNLNVFLIFADFGIEYNAYREASANSSSNNYVKFSLIKKYIRLSLIVGSLNLLISIFFLSSKETFLLGVYIFFNAFTLPGLIAMSLLRGFGRDLDYLVLFNLSWPIALIILLINNRMGHTLDNKEQYLAFLPLISSGVCGLIAIAMCYKNRTSESDVTTEQAHYFKRSHWPFFVLVTSAFATQIDKILLIRIYNPEGAISYLISSILMVSTINSISAVGKTVWGLNLSRSSSRYHLHLKDLLIIGICASFLYFIGILLLINLKLIVIPISYSLIAIMSATIFSHSILTSFQSFLTYKNLHLYRLKGNFLQFTSIVCLSLFQTTSITINFLALTVLISLNINLVYTAYHSTRRGK